MCNFSETSVENNYLVAHSACSLTLAVIGTVGNVSSIVLICHARLYKNLTMILLSNLCLADLILTSVILPLLGISGFHEGWLYGDTFCQIFAYVLYVTLSSEFFLLILITINQYLIVVKNMRHPALHQFGQKVKLALTLLSPWLLSACVYLLPLSRTWGQFGFDHRIQMCTLLNLKGTLGMKSTFSLINLVISIAIISYCYSAIFCVQHRSRRKTAPSKTASSAGAAPRLSMTSRNAQLIRMISVILVNFGVTYIPFFIMYAADPCLENTPPAAVVAIVYISFSHAATNPLIYAFMNKQIFSEWKKVIVRCLALRKLPLRMEPRERSRIFLLTERQVAVRPGYGNQIRTVKELGDNS